MPLSPPPGPRLCLGPLHPASSVVRLDCPQLSSCPQVLQGCGVATYKLAPGHLAFHRQTDPTHLAQVLCQIRRTHSCPVMTPQLHCHHTLDHTPDTKCYSTSSSPCGSGTGLQMTTLPASGSFSAATPRSASCRRPGSVVVSPLPAGLPSGASDYQRPLSVPLRVSEHCLPHLQPFPCAHSGLSGVLHVVSRTTMLEKMNLKGPFAQEALTKKIG